MRVSLSLLSAMSAEALTMVGPAVKAAGWYGPTNGLHTVSIKVSSFSGKVYLDGSLAPTPGDADWFALPLNGADCVEYPRPDYVGGDPYQVGETSMIGLNVMVNCLWLRARVDRTYLVLPEAQAIQIMPFGMVDEILVNY